MFYHKNLHTHTHAHMFIVTHIQNEQRETNLSTDTESSLMVTRQEK